MPHRLAQQRLAAFALVALSASVAADTSRQHGAHQHGAARLDVAVEATDLVIALHTPAANVVGFEHPPRDDTEREAVASALARLADGENLFGLADAAACRLESADIDTPLADHQNHDGDHDPDRDDHEHEEGHEQEHEEEHEHHADGESHSDIDATWTFHCDAPDALKSIEVRLFKHFDGFEAVEVQLVGPGGQTAMTLAPDAVVITW